MHFAIGPHTYTVHRQWELKVDGERVDGYCAATVRRILLDGALGDDVIVSVLRHEHYHAFEWEFGVPRTDEDRAQFSATVATAFDKDFNAQGGLAALLERPIGGIRPNATKLTRIPMNFRAISDRIECGWCGAQIMCGSIFTSQLTIHEEAGVPIVERGCQCPVCDRVMVWSERATAEGMPLGEYHSPRLLHGEEADEWLNAHRELHSPYNVG